MKLNAIDYAVIAAYLMILVGIGWYLKKRASQNLTEYFLAGRKMPWWALGISNTAAWLDMTGTMIIVSFLFLIGPRGLYIEFRGGACLALSFFMLWMGKWHRRSGVMTGAEWMIYRFGDGVWGHVARISFVVFMVVLSLGMLAYSFKGAGLFLSMFLPFSPLICTLIMMLVTTFYTLEAGFVGVVFTDIFQMVCVLVAVVFIVILAMNMVSGEGNLAALAKTVTGNAQWTDSWPRAHTTMPRGYEDYSLLTMMALFYLAKTFVQGPGWGFDPKYFGARSDRECGLLSFMSGWTIMFRWPLMLGFAILGLFLVRDLFPHPSSMLQAAQLIQTHAGPVSQNLWPDLLANIANHPGSYASSLTNGLQDLLGPQWGDKLSLLSYHGTVDPERILPAVILFLVSPGMRGLLLVALLAAAMSTFNAIINMTSAYLTQDIYQVYLRPHASNRELIRVSYAAGIFQVAAGMAMAYSTTSINDIWGWLTMGLTAGMGVPIVLRFYWWRFNGSGFAVGAIAGLLAAVCQRAFFPRTPEWQQFVLLLAISLTGSVLGTYMSRPTERRVLENFYRTTRPFGFWKPLQDILPPSVLQSMRAEHRNDLLSLPFALGWQITLLLIPMQLMIGNFRDLWITVPIFSLCLAGLYVFWYRKLPPA